MIAPVTALTDILGKSLLSISKTSEKRWSLELDGTAVLPKAIEALSRDFKARLITISCIDNPAYFELLYHLEATEVITLRTRIWKPANVVDSIADVMPAAELIEHEITELFGILFTGNPRPDNMILSDSQNQLKPLRNRVSSLEARMDGNVSNIIEHSSTTAPSKRVMKSRSNIGMPENPPLCSITCPAKNIVYEIAHSSGTVSRHPNLKKKEDGQ